MTLGDEHGMPARDWSRRDVLRAAASGAAVLAAGSCTGGRRPPHPDPGPLSAIGAAGGRPVVIGCIAPFSGPYASSGQVVSASLSAATGHIETDLGGSYNGYRPVIIKADAPLTAADGQKAYATLKARGVNAVLWCGSQGLAESLPDIVRDLMPVMAVGTDIQGRTGVDGQVPDLTNKTAAGFPVFQTSVPEQAAMDLLLGYARTDRGFDRAAIVFSTSSYPGIDAVFAAACRSHGLANVGSPGFDSSSGPPDMGPTVAALRRTGAQVLVVAGAPEDAVALVTSLDAAGSRYIDTPTAKGPGFAPMVVGLGGATSTAVFSRLAGTHAAKGTAGASTLGATVGLPTMPMRDWIKRFVPGYNGGLPQGGEDGPADAVAAVVNAASVARSTRGADLVAALETGAETRFATAVGTRFGPDRHVSVTTGDLCLQTLEYEPETRYNLGTEWHTIFPAGYRAPDLLVDFTLARNRQVHPHVMNSLLTLHYGISHRPSYQGGDAAREAACEAIH